MIPIEPILDKYDCEYNPSHDNNQQVKCPFHDDRRASASVNLSKGLFKCFTCDVAGDAIELLILREGMDFAEAKRLAEEMAGGSSREISPELDPGDSFLPRKSGARQNRRGWRSPWGRT